MEAHPQQLTVVSTKIDALQQVVEELNLKLTTVLLTQAEDHNGTIPLAAQPSTRVTASEAELSHKDVLLDSQSFDIDRHGGDKPLTPEVQIQRLTAQLTAAYNRIAVLEEQLLAQRVH
ncbi:MAG: hypothetical protein AAF329_10900 [Cyanobacteria bacterium P01_A01_bin.17]